MGKGSNASKTARARLDAAKNEAKPGGGGATGKAERMGTHVMTIVCSVCKTSFMATQTRPQLEAHRESKHDKLSFDVVFPTFVEK